LRQADVVRDDGQKALVRVEVGVLIPIDVVESQDEGESDDERHAQPNKNVERNLARRPRSLSFHRPV
jgi:hypothetical protein